MKGTAAKPVLACGCPTDGRLIIRVGKAVTIRNRLQTHVFGHTLRRPSDWVDEFLEEPHNHVLEVAIWYADKTEISIAEAVLIDALQPIRNINDRNFGRPDLWPFRRPDAEGIPIFDFEPGRHPRKGVACASLIKNEPGVYAFYVDPGLELLAIWSALKGLPCESSYRAARQKIREAIRHRISAAKAARNAFASDRIG